MICDSPAGMGGPALAIEGACAVRPEDHCSLLLFGVCKAHPARLPQIFRLS